MAKEDIDDFENGKKQSEQSEQSHSLWAKLLPVVYLLVSASNLQRILWMKMWMLKAIVYDILDKKREK